MWYLAICTKRALMFVSKLERPRAIPKDGCHQIVIWQHRCRKQMGNVESMLCCKLEVWSPYLFWHRNQHTQFCREWVKCSETGWFSVGGSIFFYESQIAVYELNSEISCTLDLKWTISHKFSTCLCVDDMNRLWVEPWRRCKFCFRW